MDWPGHARQRSTLRLYRNNRNGTFTDVTHAARASTLRCTGWASPSAISTTTVFPICSSPASGRTGCFATRARARSSTRRVRAGWRGGRHSARRRCGSISIATASSTCSSATTCKWSAEHDVFCSLDGKQKSYCTPEAYRGDTCWLFHNRGNGTFEDVTATSGDLRHQLEIARRRDARRRPGRLAGFVRGERHAAEQAVPQSAQRHVQRRRRGGRARVQRATGRRARAWAWTRQISTTPGRATLAITNFDNEMIGLYRPLGRGLYEDVATRRGHRRRRRATRSDSGASSPTSISTGRSIWSSPTGTSTRPCATSAGTSATRSRRSLF